MPTSLDIQITLLALAASLVIFVVQKRRQPPLPPGPPGRLFAGIVDIHPHETPWFAYHDWAKKYAKDGLMSFHIWGSRRVVITDMQTADEMFVNNSILYSDRPQTMMASKLCGLGESSLLTCPYDKRLQRCRTLINRGLNSPELSKEWQQSIVNEGEQLIKDLTEIPREFRTVLRKYSVSLYMLIIMGHKVQSENDPYVALVEEKQEVLGHVLSPGWVVDTLPWVRYIPFLSFMRKAKGWNDHLREVEAKLYLRLKTQIKNGSASPCVAWALLEDDDSVERNTDVRNIINALFTAANDTVTSTITTFVGQMIFHPEVQRKIQAELAEVIGPGRLPTLAERKQMPYTERVIMETLRMGPAAPLCIAHRACKDTVFRGYRIPADATLLPNIWGMLNDSATYSSPHIFNPDRYIGLRAEPDPRNYAFGFGHRICLGAKIAEMSLFIQITHIMSSFDIGLPVDEKGERYEPKLEYMGNFATILKPYDCTITPRKGTVPA